MPALNYALVKLDPTNNSITIVDSSINITINENSYKFNGACGRTFDNNTRTNVQNELNSKHNEGKLVNALRAQLAALTPAATNTWNIPIDTSFYSTSMAAVMVVGQLYLGLSHTAIASIDMTPSLP